MGRMQWGREEGEKKKKGKPTLQAYFLEKPPACALATNFPLTTQSYLASPQMEVTPQRLSQSSLLDLLMSEAVSKAYGIQCTAVSQQRCFLFHFLCQPPKHSCHSFHY